MTKLKGITVTLINKEQVGKDDFGATIYEDKHILVNNVLIAPTSTDDVINQLNLTGKKVSYTLGIPKEDNNNWIEQEVLFFGRRWKTVGVPLEGINSMMPLSWNKKVMVEYYG